MLPGISPSDNQKGLATKQLLVAAGIAFTIVLVLGLAASLLLKAIGPTQTATDKPVTLTYWGLWESEEVMQPLLDEYHQLHPNVTINYEQRPITNYFSSLTSRFENGDDDLPDIARLHDSWMSAMQDDLSALPDSVMNASQYESTFYTFNRYQLRHDGKYYAMPLEVDDLALVYNQDLFNQAGITAAPTTWDEVRQDAAKLTKRDKAGKLQVGGIAMGTANNVDHFPDIIALLMAQNGVQFTDSKGKAAFHDSVTADGRNLGAEALAFYTLFSTTDKDWDATMEPSTVAFAAGKVGMIFIPSWQLLSLVSQNPNLPLKVAPVPQLTADQHVGYASYWVEVVPKKSKNQQAAWEFLAWLTGKEQQTNLVNNQLVDRPFGEPYSRVELASLLANDQYLAPYVSQANGLRASFFAGNTGDNEFNKAINDALAKAVTQTQSANSSQTTAAATALDEVAKVVDKEIDN